jgi:murein DD-endopeptidase MepM/ murein hydrolase activator NlpD
MCLSDSQAGKQRIPAQKSFSRIRDKQKRGTGRSPGSIGGNYVAIDQGNGEFSIYAHLKSGSVNMEVGDVVKAGHVIGKLGSSDNSTEPHLDFQVCDRPEPLNCAGIPVNFTGIALPDADYARPLQSGTS